MHLHFNFPTAWEFRSKSFKILHSPWISLGKTVTWRKGGACVAPAVPGRWRTSTASSGSFGSWSKWGTVCQCPSWDAWTMKAPVSPWFHLGLAQVLSLKFARVPQLIFIHFQHPKIGFRLFEPCPQKVSWRWRWWTLCIFTDNVCLREEQLRSQGVFGR